MTRPQIIRADTIDLQDPSSPSAQDHSSVSSRVAEGRTGPHQNQSLRHAEQEARDDVITSPRVSLHHLDNGDQNHHIDIVYDEPDDSMADLKGEDGDIGDEESDDMMDDDMMDKISSSPSIDDEDIDFEFVYALHTFVATVEGQANAAKGDTMVLLDDSNSYWWLVRVVKDGSIGYLPAEHIETPTERLARLNKHRNVDLSATMLGDNAEKSKNPLKKAMRRRNAKTVTFASPTFFEASDIDYSTEEEEEDAEQLEEEEIRVEPQDAQYDVQDEDMVVEPLRPKPHKEKVSRVVEPETEETQTEPSSPEKPRPSDESFERPARSRNGTLRNTDSFFNDDTAETKKISITPSLLRDDNGVSKSEAQEGRASMESIEKTLAAGDKGKRKDKKPGMLSGLFKRKDKKGRTSEDDGEDAEKTSEEISRSSPQPKVSSESLREPTNTKASGVQRQSSKLQKQQPAEVALVNPSQRAMQDTSISTSEASSPVKEDYSSSIRRVLSPSAGATVAPLQVRTSFENNAAAPEQRTPSDYTSSPVKTSPVATSNITSSMGMNGKMHDGPIAEEPIQTMSREDPSSNPVSPSRQLRGNVHSDDSLSDSVVNVSPTQAPMSSRPPGLVVDTSSQEGRSVSPLSSKSSSPEFIERPEPKGDETTPVSTVSSVATATWSDASLRSYLDDENDIRDLLIIVHDKSNVQPAGPDHPITGSLFKEESRRLKEMSGRLDEMLAGWISRKSDRVSKAY
ncbi:SH3 domain protein, putative [Talaromyces stipitatus ATCC 10500]|uniref:SH3 domain protein, putative n=1 Tax=Talaromyces stipitatus (strain ATCC 10500 / CBS 375.48 / QM 6759 / NRRL 1006) TaxID=441959 RepID=B8MK64_TALSN|nr:SH3 domain protein, putative [Talaromyces stipitatus ATCC 10500]EED14881.1 SH3 domain protein, putative [Talaromyces stipitatus ATCC 10500]